jgi:hypothetical protein
MRINHCDLHSGVQKKLLEGVSFNLGEDEHIRFISYESPGKNAAALFSFMFT